MVASLVSDVRIPAGSALLDGVLVIPAGARSLVLFAHGSGSSRASPRNRFIADALNAAGMGTLLFDLYTPDECSGRVTPGDVPRIASRLAAAARWVARERADAPRLRIGYFGASTGAAAALRAASEDIVVRAVVSRGGRPDLAGATSLTHVRAPTLLIVGGNDPEVLALNREAHARLACPKSLEIVPGATHLFEEPGTLEHVAQLATGWFRHWFAVAGERDKTPGA